MKPLREFVEEMRWQMPSEDASKDWLYIIEGASLYKIGRTQKRICKRLAQFQTGSPVQLRIVGYARGLGWAEPMLHQRFAKARVRGEWFDPRMCLELRTLVSRCDLEMAHRDFCASALGGYPEEEEPELRELEEAGE